MSRFIRPHPVRSHAVRSLLATALLLGIIGAAAHAKPRPIADRGPDIDKIAVATGTGLTGKYYDDSGNGSHFGTHRITRTDSQVNFAWGTGSPGGGVQSDNFSVRWFGQVEAPTSGSYTFSTTSDDGVRLWVDNVLVIDNWTDHTSTTNSSGAITLSAAQRYQIAMEYYDHSSGATAVLMWAYPGQAQQAIPQSRLYPSALRLDRVGPTVSITSPTAAQILAGTISITASATDNTGVVGVQFSLDGAPLGAEDTSSPYSVPWNTTLATNGSHTLTAMARDQAGNARTTTALSISVNNATGGGPVFYASPTGSASGTGSITSPWDLATALTRSSSVVPPGSTIYLRGGTYHGGVRSFLTGQAGNPVTVRQFPGERAIIDGAGVTTTQALAIEGQWAIYRDFEVLNSETNRNGTNRPTGVDLYGPNVKLVNLVVHDNGNGIGFWEFARDSEVYGCVVFNNGVVSATSGRGAGHGMYIQNDTGTKRIADVVAVNNFGFGLHAYGEGGRANGLTFENNASFNNGSQASRGSDDRFPNLLVGTVTNGISNLHIIGNYLYHQSGTEPSANLSLGYGATNNDVEMRDNWIMGGDHLLSMSKWGNVTTVNNTFFCMNDPGSGEFVTSISLASGQSSAGYTWNGNTYYDTVTPGTPVDFGWAGQLRTFANWRTATGFDSTSTYTQARPSGVNVFVQPNEYEQGRANIMVYNWSGATTVDVDVSQVLTIGAVYEVRSAQNYLGTPVLTGTWTGGLLRIPITNTTVATATGFDFTPASTAPEFNTYVLITR